MFIHSFVCYAYTFLHVRKTIRLVVQRFSSFICRLAYPFLHVTKMVTDWSVLPADTIDVISTRLDNDADFVRCRSVCSSWRSAVPKRPLLPWLLIAHGDNSDFGLINFPNAEVLSPPHPEGIAGEKLVCGSSRGWIALLDGTLGMSLDNPLTGAHIKLPPLTDLPPNMDGRRVRKSGLGFVMYNVDGTWVSGERPLSFYGKQYLFENVVLSSNPTAEDCFVMAICYQGERIIHCRPGDACWTLSPPFKRCGFQSVIFYKGLFYAVSNYRVFVCETGPDARVTEVLPACPLFSDGQNSKAGGWSYLVVSSGALLLATYRCDDYNDVWEVFRIDIDGGRLRLFKMQDLGGGVLFLVSRSTSVYAVNSSWCKANCIYFPGNGPTTDRNLNMVMKVFSTEDDTTSVVDILPNAFSQYYWFTPNLCC